MKKYPTLEALAAEVANTLTAAAQDAGRPQSVFVAQIRRKGAEPGVWEAESGHTAAIVPSDEQCVVTSDGVRWHLDGSSKAPEAAE